jgi:hypothetical protein
VLYGYETLSLSLRDKERLVIFENRMKKRIFGHTRGNVKKGWKKNYIIRSSIICTLHEIMFR